MEYSAKSLTFSYSPPFSHAFPSATPSISHAPPFSHAFPSATSSISHAPPFSHAFPSATPSLLCGYLTLRLDSQALPGKQGTSSWQLEELALGSIFGASLFFLLSLQKLSQIPCGRNKKHPPLSPCTVLLEALPSGVRGQAGLGRGEKETFSCW